MKIEADAPVLSVCIPTYNYGRYIGETLQSILGQATSAVEVVVLDSASTDDTPDVVSRLQGKYPSLRYVRAERKQGIDRDLAHVVDLARGEYCWLFSADDLMIEGAIRRVCEEIKSNEDVYLCMHSLCSAAMEEQVPRYPVLSSSVDRSFRLSDSAQRRAYFESALTTEALFSFMSSLVVKRETWRSVMLNETFVGSCWAHAARLFELMEKGLSVRYLSSVLLRKRGEVDSFSSGSTVRRYALAIEGYQRIGEHFWGADSAEAFHIRRLLRNEFHLGFLLHGKHDCLLNPGLEDRQRLDRMVASIYDDGSWSVWARHMVYRAFPAALVPHAFAAWTRLKPMMGRR
jgi:abequosyltransferase